MKKRVAVIVLLLAVLMGIGASPCFEEVELVTLSVAASCASIPQLTLPGVIREGGGLIPDKVVFRESDVSLYLDALSVMPEGSGILDSAAFALSQRSSLMNQIKTMLSDASLNEGNLIVDGSVKITQEREVERLSVAVGNLSSMDLKAVMDITIVSRGKEWHLKGTFYIEGDTSGALSVESDSVRVNDSRYRVDLKYRLKKKE